MYSFIGKIVGISFSVLLSFGTHQTSIGVQAKGYVGLDYAQFNFGNALEWKLYSVGKRRFFFENRTYAGLCLMAGPERATIDFELDGLAHQTKKTFGIAYNYLLYIDNVGTSQFSGAFGLHFKNVTVRFENDVFAGQARDRFRTAIVQVAYRTIDTKWSTGLYLWTGETAGSHWDKTATTRKMPYGYRSLEELPYGKTSHGIAYAGVHHRMKNNNVASLKMGVDSEQIRHFFQNRLIHDLIFLPKNIERNTPHYPRLDQDGCPTFEKQMVRKAKIYMQMGLNTIDN